ncbi:MAG: hypothetical protein O3C40_05195 [Planctomycetota bacterium]|nr:hypothetical protein [Planctomycetota bacterium]
MRQGLPRLGRLLLTLLTSRLLLLGFSFGNHRLFELLLQLGDMRGQRTLFLAGGLLGAKFGGGLLGVGDGLIGPWLS